VAPRRLREQESKRNALEAKIAALRAAFEVETEEMHEIAEDEQKRQAALAKDRLDMERFRKGQPSDPRAKRAKRRGKG
jgi:circadian clock protein KaiC